MDAYCPSVTQTNVAASATSVQLLAANPNRLKFSIVNDGTANLYISLGSAASTSNYTVKVLTGGSYTIPINYVGIVNGIWDVANGNARIAEFTQ